MINVHEVSFKILISLACGRFLTTELVDLIVDKDGETLVNQWGQIFLNYQGN